MVPLVFLFPDINMPEKPKLRNMSKVPATLPNQKHLKMKKSLHLIRGPEEVHNALLHQQYGIRVRYVLSYIFFFETTGIICSLRHTNFFFFAISMTVSPSDFRLCAVGD